MWVIFAVPVDEVVENDIACERNNASYDKSSDPKFGSDFHEQCQKFLPEIGLV